MGSREISIVTVMVQTHKHNHTNRNDKCCILAALFDTLKALITIKHDRYKYTTAT